MRQEEGTRREMQEGSAVLFSQRFTTMTQRRRVRNNGSVLPRPRSLVKHPETYRTNRKQLPTLMGSSQADDWLWKKKRSGPTTPRGLAYARAFPAN